MVGKQGGLLCFGRRTNARGCTEYIDGAWDVGGFSNNICLWNRSNVIKAMQGYITFSSFQLFFCL